MKSEGKDKEEKGREQELTGEELAKRIYVENLWSIRDLFADSCSWQGFVSSYCVLTLFLHWFYKMKYSCYQDSFVILGWLVYWFVVEKCAEQQKETGNHRFETVRVKGGMSLRNGMWHGLRSDIIMRNLLYRIAKG